ncbi:kynurenine--oxoglutarate transaminase 3-like [Lineus longissimus]|uniref:kynurenine--oxoglutarate transaminase 3-like n=1 Tax=Lineus longissimus TaxID=88925 RepID=UPI00315CC201
MEIVANLCKKHDVICIADEVYEMFTYSDQEHIKMATLPGMWERTVTVGSVGKLFGMTAWATGYVIGPEHLIEKYLQRVVIPMNTVLQDVYAQAYRHELNRLDQPNCFFKALPRELKAKRDQVMHIMSGIGLEPIAPEGGYFIFADVSKFDDQYCQASGDKASNFALWLCKEKGIGVAPASVFYSTANSHLGENYIRICFVKSEATLNIAEDRLKGVKVSRNNDEICNVLANGKGGLANCKDDLVNGKEDLTNSKDG